MTAQDLKNSILQLAVQGKLVPQDPNDEPASELLKRIRTEKERLVKEGKIKKDKALAPISEDEIPFDIPESWEWVRLGDFCTDAFSGKSPIYSKAPTSYEVIGQAANQQNGIDLSQVKYTIQEFWDAMEEKYFLRQNDVLLNTLGNGTLGRSGIVKCIDKPLLTDGHLFVFRLFSAVASRYLYYFLQFKRPEIEKSANGSTNQTFLSLTRTSNWIVPVPPLSEQERIVAKIEELLPYIEEYDRAEKQLSALNTEFPDKLRKSILQQAVMGKLTERDPADEPASELLQRIRAEKEKLIKEGKIKKEKTLPPISEDEIPFEIPDTWECVRLGEVFDVNPRNNVLDDTEVGFIPMPLLEPGFVNKHTFERKLWKEVKKNFTHFQNGDIVFAKITPCFQNRKSAIISNLPNGYGAGTTELHVLRTYSGLILNEYALWFLKNERFILDGIEHFTGSVGQQRVGTDYIKQYPFPLPPLAEQKRIVARVEELLKICDKLK